MPGRHNRVKEAGPVIFEGVHTSVPRRAGVSSRWTSHARSRVKQLQLWKLSEPATTTSTSPVRLGPEARPRHREGASGWPGGERRNLPGIVMVDALALPKGGVPSPDAVMQTVDLTTVAPLSRTGLGFSGSCPIKHLQANSLRGGAGNFLRWSREFQARSREFGSSTSSSARPGLSQQKTSTEVVEGETSRQRHRQSKPENTRRGNRYTSPARHTERLATQVPRAVASGPSPPEC
jgi:hypothetical protein